MLKAGKYKAHVMDYGFKETKAKDGILANILFEVVDSDGALHDVYWQGSFKNDKAKEITLKALLVCGLECNFSSAADYKRFNQGKGSGCLDESRMIETHVINEEYEGKTYTKVQWVNEFGSGGIREKIAENDLIAKMPGLNLAGDIAVLKQKNPPKEIKNFAPKFDTKENIPF